MAPLAPLAPPVPAKLRYEGITYIPKSHIPRYVYGVEKYHKNVLEELFLLETRITKYAKIS